ncbi:MAG: carboxypeptidase-like regulatory domain-containing protein [Prolixibacteraceae bacterium]|nr:carboxypeptidase-like regulatory domain-containing protein [Prolixibacteraceae bacterium]MBN2650718.1 carboxypeptidase-like regulatory domain-containing protein [Prolixibacteraceae bacterium]
MKKIVFVVVVLVGAVNLAFAKDKPAETQSKPAVESAISGIITDQISGEKLAGVAVRIEGTESVCYTDFEGNFEFKNLKPGNYKLDVEMISYQKIETQKINIHSGEVHELSINLKQDF